MSDNVQVEIPRELYEKLKDQICPGKGGKVLPDLDSFIERTMFFRTATYHVVGQVVGRIGHFLQLRHAAWIADSGRFADFITKGIPLECEPIKSDWWVNLEACSDFGIWDHKLPLTQK